MLLLANGGNRYALSAWNADGDPLELSFGALRLQANLTNADNAGVLGELESISHVDGTLVHSSEATQELGSYTGRSVHPGCVLWVDKVRASGRASLMAEHRMYSRVQAQISELNSYQT